MNRIFFPLGQFFFFFFFFFFLQSWDSTFQRSSIISKNESLCWKESLFLRTDEIRLLAEHTWNNQSSLWELGFVSVIGHYFTIFLTLTYGNIQISADTNLGFFYPSFLWWHLNDTLIKTLPPYADASSKITV